MQKLPSYSLANTRSLDELRRTSGGQALLIILLAMAVVLTVTLSIASRSVTDISTTTYEDEALRAFSAAEAGVEQALTVGSVDTPQTLPNGAVFQAPITQVNAGTEFIYPGSGLLSGETATFWFVSHNEADGRLICDGSHRCFRGTQVRFCFGSGSPSVKPAIEVALYSDANRADGVITNDAISNPNRFAGIEVSHLAFANDLTLVSNGFTFADVSSPDRCPNAGTGTTYESPLVDVQSLTSCNVANEAGCMLMARVRLLYTTDIRQSVAMTVQGVVGTNSLPPQGRNIESTGTSGESRRQVTVFQSYPALPAFFDVSMFSSGNLEKP